VSCQEVIRPPATSIVTPVSQEAASEARKRGCRDVVGRPEPP
jgi:hypothetical protein